LKTVRSYEQIIEIMDENGLIVSSDTIRGMILQFGVALFSPGIITGFISYRE
jgi:hypothetical protein